MSETPKDFLPGFESYGEFRSALNDADEADEISKQKKPVERESEDEEEEQEED